MKELLVARVPPRVFYVCSASKGVKLAGFVGVANEGDRERTRGEGRGTRGKKKGRRIEFAGAISRSPA